MYRVLSDVQSADFDVAPFPDQPALGNTSTNSGHVPVVQDDGADALAAHSGGGGGGDDSGIEVLVAETELTGTAPDASDCAASGFRSPTIDPGRTLTSADNDKMLIMELVRR